MPSNNFQSPFQANTLPPQRRNGDSRLETALANMTIRPFARSTIPPPFTHIVSVDGQGIIITASNHVHTSEYNLGDNTRSYLEGMVPITGTTGPRRTRTLGTTGPRNSGAIGTAEPRTSGTIHTVGSRNSGAFGTTGPRSSRAIASQTRTARSSILKSSHDVEMASQQMNIETMAPTERSRQETWAQTMIQRTSSCPQKYAWNRISGGYHCEGGHHYISDELLAEGNGGVLLLNNPSELYPNYGPYYPDPNRDGQFLYSGSLPRPKSAPEYINEMGNSKPSLSSRLHGRVVRAMGRGSQSRSSQLVTSSSRASQTVNSRSRG